MDVRTTPLRDATRAGPRDGLTLRNRGALCDVRLSEVAQRDGVAVSGQDRDRLAVGRHRAGERHRAGRRREDVFTGLRSHVDASVLAGRVRVGPERERAQHLAARRPAPSEPGVRDGQDDQRCYQDDHQTSHVDLSPLLELTTDRER
jgi:hypothetical protein